MTHRDIVVIGASAGGVAALRRLASQLPADLDAALFVVVHTSPRERSLLAEVLSSAGPLPAVEAEDGQPIVPGRIVVAPPDRHLLLEPGHLVVVRGPRENRHRPAIDPLFRSAAWAFGPRVVAVVLSGGLDDGASGLWAVKSCGGTTIVQDPDDAEYPQMPTEALAANRVDHRLPLAAIGPQIVRLVQQGPPAAASSPKPPGVADEVRAARGEAVPEVPARLGRLSPFTCPSCHGALWELDHAGDLHYRCHTGHAFGPDTLLAGQAEELEDSLYTALRAVQEKASALRRLAERLPAEVPRVKQQYERRAEQLDRSSNVLRALLAGTDPGPEVRPVGVEDA